MLLASHDRAGSFLETPPGSSSDPRGHLLHLAGQRIGAYEIVSRLGAGGMGEVYRARDLKLGREVAIKVLPHVFTRDPERLARFEREARVLAALNQLLPLVLWRTAKAWLNRALGPEVRP